MENLNTYVRTHVLKDGVKIPVKLHAVTQGDSLNLYIVRCNSVDISGCLLQSFKRTALIRAQKYVNELTYDNVYYSLLKGGIVDNVLINPKKDTNYRIETAHLYAVIAGGVRQTSPMELATAKKFANSFRNAGYKDAYIEEVVCKDIKVAI